MNEINDLRKMEMCITSTCNLKCKHCYQHFEKNKYNIDKNKIFEIIDYAYSHGCKQIILSGGEIFMREDIYEIIKYISLKKIEITLVTNGTLIDIEKISQFRNQKLIFQISIDGDEKRHDDRRGKGNYVKTLNVIRELKKIGYKVKANVTLDNDNYRFVPNIINNKLYDEVTFLPVANVGAAKLNGKSKSSNELNQYIELLYKTVPKTRTICDKCCIFPNGISINYDGFVYPCSIARDFKLIQMGNIFDKSISKIIDDFCGTEVAKRLLNYKSNNQIEKCRKCMNKEKCNQGCRIRALKFNGNLLKPDPFCCKIFNGEYKNIDYSDIYWGNK